MSRIKAFKYNRLFNFYHSFSLTVELTTKCNLSCNICCRPNIDIPSKDMSQFLVEKIMIDSKFLLRKKNVNFNPIGLGEPLLYTANLPEIMNLFRENYPNGRITVNTNCLLLDGSHSQMLLDSLTKENDTLALSISASDAESYKILNNSDKYNEVCKNVENFLILRGLSNTPRINIRFIKCDYTDWNKFEEKWGYAVKNYSNVYLVKFPLLNWGKMKPPKTMKKRYPCLSLWSELVFDVDGNVYPCCRALEKRTKSSLFLGNITNTSIDELYEKIGVYRKQHLDDVYIGDCENCDFWSEAESINTRLIIKHLIKRLKRYV